jgi:hypothetical protein
MRLLTEDGYFARKPGNQSARGETKLMLAHNLFRHNPKPFTDHRKVLIAYFIRNPAIFIAHACGVPIVKPS